ncbi:MAG TPA: signal peptide peptidase SppA [Terriglobales bacterium]|nr:signal peptide peptidase SppA [Terriglobales bacterium]
MSEQRSRTWLWVLLGCGAFFVLLIAVLTLVGLAAGRHNSDFAGFGDKIGVVDLEGVIIEPQTMVHDLKEFADDDSVKAIIIHINTPGGGAAASQEIYSEVKRIRDEKKKKIVSSVESVGASGGYYVASGTEKIYANPASIVGSIGVISQWFNYEDLLKWAKLKDVTFKAGALKDTGNPAREMTPEEKAYFQSLIDDMHQQFIRAVADGRKIKFQDVQKIADGRVWTGQQALPLKLVDKLGDFEMAVDETAKSVGIKGEPVLVHPEKKKRTLLDVIFGDISDIIPSQAKLLDTHRGFYYLWK